MGRLQSIENALASVNETVFQELGDSFLAVRNKNYSSFSRTGSQSGKQKTIKGTPDSFLLLQDGTYLFVEHSTNVTEGVKKLGKDIAKCLDVEKSKIPHNKIKEIILCINFNLKSEEIIALQKIIDTSKTRIALSVYMLDILALELHLHHRDLVNLYLGLPLDTGQVVSTTRFIEEYEKASKGIATPLGNNFMHRDEEVKALNNAIEFHDFIIVTGPAGVGKTKLCLETINVFLQENTSYKAYCISYKSHTLIDDLHQYLSFDEDCILFVDDANRIDRFAQVTGFYKAPRKGKLKIVITVRDYAFQQMDMLCNGFAPYRITVSKLTDEQITDIIKADSFNILNSEYQKEIIKIADGNPRLAIMAALLAIAKQDIYALSNVAELFEMYFSTFVKDDGKFADDANVKILGLIAFFNVLPYKKRAIIDPILHNFGLEYHEFIDKIDVLEELELVDIQFEHVKVAEQNLAIFFFYKAFIDTDLLSFDTLLKLYFVKNASRFTDTIIPANNNFGPQFVMDKLQPQLKSYLNSIRNTPELIFNFFKTFWFYLQDETLNYLYEITEHLQPHEDKVYIYNEANNNPSRRIDKTLNLLGEFYRFPTSKISDALEISIEYVKKQKNKFHDFISIIRDRLLYDIPDGKNGFYRQNLLFDLLIKNLDSEDQIYILAFIELAKIFLRYKFQHTKFGRGDTIQMYHYPLPDNEHVHKIRMKILEALKVVFRLHPEKAFDVLTKYAQRSPDIEPEIIWSDLPSLIELIRENLITESLEHCQYVERLTRWLARHNIISPELSDLLEKFTNPLFEMYLKIDYDFLREKNQYEFTDHDHYRKFKEEEARKSFVFKSREQIEAFHDDFLTIKNMAKNQWHYNQFLEIVIDENFMQDCKIGLEFLRVILDKGNQLYYIPVLPFHNHLNTTGNLESIKELLLRNPVNYTSQWKLGFYRGVADHLVKTITLEEILETIRSINEPCSIVFGRLERYQVIYPEMFNEIFRIVYEKNLEDQFKITIWDDVLEGQVHSWNMEPELIKKSYLQQHNGNQDYDYEGKALFRILKDDGRFLTVFVEHLFKDDPFHTDVHDRKLGFVWSLDNIEKYMKEVFDYVISKDDYNGIGEHFCNVFFRDLEDENKAKAESFLFQYLEENSTDSNKVNTIVDIVRNAQTYFFEKVLLRYLELNQNVTHFSNIWWRGNGGSYSGDVNIGDSEASDWRNIYIIIEKSKVGIKLLPIKAYVKNEIDDALKQGDWERERKFLQHSP